MPTLHRLSSLTPTLVLNWSLKTPAAAVALGLAASYPCFAAQAQEQTFSIPAQSMHSALQTFAKQTNIQVLYSPDDVAGVNSRGVNGKYTVDQAIVELLRGSPLVYSFNDNTLTLTARSTSAVELGATNVHGQGLGATTEGTGSYTTGSAQTATKLPLSLRETPQSVTVITRQRIEDQGLANLNEVVQNTPGLTLRRTGPERSSYYARGFSLDNIMYDGLPTSLDSSQVSQDLLSADMAMYDRVEVVRGATGLMQGAGNPSAAINLIRKRPTREFKASIQGSAGTWDRYRTEVDVGGPLNDNGSVRGRMVAAYQTGKSFRDTLENERNLFYGIMEADLNDSTTLTLSASRQQDNNNGNGWTGLPVGVGGKDLHLSRSTSLSSDWEYWDKVSTSAYAALEHILDNGWKLNLSATKTWADLDMLGTYIVFPAATQEYNQYVGAGHYRETQNSFDAYASGPFRLMDREHELVVGASHRRVVFNGDVPYNILLNGDIDPENWDSGATPKPESQDKYGWQNTNAKLNSFYATTRLSLADPLKLILGSRLDWYDNTTTQPYKGEAGNLPELKVTRHVTKYAGLIYDLNENHSVYASYTDIFKPQNYVDESNNVIAPITGKNYELGIKGEYFDGALNASAAIFQIDQENRAKSFSCNTTFATTCYEASGKVRSKGIELELQGQLTPNWELAAGYTFAEAKYVKDATKANEGRLFDTDIPRHLFKMSTTYTLPGQFNQWRVGTSLYHQNRIYNKGTNYMIEQDGYTLVDFMVGFKPTENIDARLNLNNAFDKKYYNSLSNNVTVPSSVYGDPRNLMLSVKYTF